VKLLLLVAIAWNRRTPYLQPGVQQAARHLFVSGTPPNPFLIFFFFSSKSIFIRSALLRPLSWLPNFNLDKYY
jgi:hypothetical protein